MSPYVFGGRAEFQGTGNRGGGISLGRRSMNKEILCPLWEKVNTASREKGRRKLGEVIGLVKVELNMQIE